MWALLSRRFRRWLLMVVAVPLLGALARRLADRIEERSGPTRTSRALDSVGRAAQSPKQRQRQRQSR
jgi:hypothetical protein